MEAIGSEPLRVGALVWQSQPGAHVFTVVCKLAFQLAPGESRLAPAPAALVPFDVFSGSGERAQLAAPSDLVPFKVHPEVIVTGHARSPGGRPVESLLVRVAALDLDKVLSVHGDRSLSPSGELSDTQPFTRMPLAWDRAAGGPDTVNPAGVVTGPGARADASGRVTLPNVLPVGRYFPARGDVLAPAGLGPVAAAWPWRRRFLGQHAAAWDALRWNDRPLPPDFGGAYFQAAPPDQKVSELPPDARLFLENLSPRHPQLATRLSPVTVSALVETAGTRAPLRLRCDTLLIDADAELAVLVYRGSVPLRHPNQEGRVVVTAATSAVSAAVPGEVQATSPAVPRDVQSASPTVPREVQSAPSWGAGATGTSGPTSGGQAPAAANGPASGGQAPAAANGPASGAPAPVQESAQPAHKTAIGGLGGPALPFEPPGEVAAMLAGLPPDVQARMAARLAELGDLSGVAVSGTVLPAPSAKPVLPFGGAAERAPSASPPEPPPTHEAGAHDEDDTADTRRPPPPDPSDASTTASVAEVPRPAPAAATVGSSGQELVVDPRQAPSPAPVAATVGLSGAAPAGFVLPAAWATPGFSVKETMVLADTPSPVAEGPSPARFADIPFGTAEREIAPPPRFADIPFAATGGDVAPPPRFADVPFAATGGDVAPPPRFAGIPFAATGSEGVWPASTGDTPLSAAGAAIAPPLPPGDIPSVAARGEAGDAGGIAPQEPAPAPAPEPPPMIGPLAKAPEGDPGLSAETGDSPAPEGAGAAADEPLAIDDYPVERYARIAASVDLHEAESARILGEHGLSEGTWEQLRQHWGAAVRDEAARGKSTSMRAYDAAYIAQIEAERGPIEVDEYAQITVAMDRGQAEEALASLGLPRRAAMPIRRVWTARMFKDPKLAARVRRALAEGRER